ncbi:MAG: sulfotransferase family 2 domain-containing protein [Pseudomonadota bacterium]
MFVSHAHRFIFLRTEKTGGTSLDAALRAVFDEGITFPGQVRPSWSKKLPFSYGGLQRRAPRLFGLHPHATAADARAVLGKSVFDSYFKFAVERNPWDRQISLYTHREWKKGKDNKNFDKDMQSILYRSTELCRLNNFAMYAIDGAVVCDRVLDYATLHDDLKTLATERGWPDITAHLPRLRQYSGERPHYSTYYSDETRDLIARWYKSEINAFNYTFDDRR